MTVVYTGIIPVTLIVFSIVLILTKSKVLAGKREYVKKRYEASKVGGQRPSWIHRWFHAMFTCPMCCGFWISLIICFIYPVYSYFADVMICFGLNWLLHCLESVLFFSGELLEKNEDIEDLD